jgi:hypothetical protein
VPISPQSVPAALEVGARYRGRLRKVAEDHYDWVPVARRLRQLLEQIAADAPAARNPVP